jgi:rod shape determining protein RodA
MPGPHYLDHSYDARLTRKVKQLRLSTLHIDPLLFLGLLILCTIGIFNLYSASNQYGHLVKSQLLHYLVAFILMLCVAQIPPRYLRVVSPWLYGIALFSLFLVFFFGHVSQGARRWLGVGSFLVQPSELMKIAMPMMLSWLWQQSRQYNPQYIVSLSLALLLIPVLLIAKQPDLGTAILIGLSGMYVLLLAGLDRKIIISGVVLVAAMIPFGWHMMHDYQKMRVITFLYPEKDPLGSGYNIIQSKIAVGSGGFAGKGYLHGTQSHLSFLPAHTTDFIFSVGAEEWGFIGCCLLIACYCFIFVRSSILSLQAQDVFSRLLTGSLSLIFITCALINMGMVVGLLPVVGVPLPFMSYGGSSMMSMMVSFGMIMSVQTHKKLWASSN